MFTLRRCHLIFTLTLDMREKKNIRLSFDNTAGKVRQKKSLKDVVKVL